MIVIVHTGPSTIVIRLEGIFRNLRNSVWLRVRVGIGMNVRVVLWRYKGLKGERGGIVWVGLAAAGGHRWRLMV